MNYGKEIIKIKTDIKDIAVLQKMINPIEDFCNKNEILYDIYFNQFDELLMDCSVTCKTTSLCKGLISELKVITKNIFNCKLETILKAY